MKGIILGFDSINGGYIRAEDGKRYLLTLEAWRGARPPRTGEEVDFEVVNSDVASDVYPLVNATESTTESLSKTLNTVGKAFAGSVSRVAAEASNRLSEGSNLAKEVGGSNLSSNPTIQQVHRHGKKISASMFALILICFFLPFVTVSCESTPIVAMSGFELITGKTISTPTFTGQTRSQKIPGSAGAALVFVAGAVGVGTNLAKIRKSSLISAGVGAFGLVMLLWLKSGIDKGISEAGATYSGFRANYGLGFWMPVLLFFLASCLNVWLFLQKRIDREPTI